MNRQSIEPEETNSDDTSTSTTPSKEFDARQSETQDEKTINQGLEYYCMACDHQLSMDDNVCPSYGNSSEDEKKLVK